MHIFQKYTIVLSEGQCQTIQINLYCISFDGIFHHLKMFQIMLQLVYIRDYKTELPKIDAELTKLDLSRVNKNKI